VEGGFRFRDGNSSSQRLEGFGWNDNFALVESGSDALALVGGTPGVRFLDQSANEHLAVTETGTNGAKLTSASSMYLYAGDNLHINSADAILFEPDEADQSGGDLKIYNYRGGTQYATFDGSTQRVGIGTVAPPAKLSIEGDGADTSGIQLSSDGSNWSKIYANTSDNVVIDTGGSYFMIKRSGFHIASFSSTRFYYDTDTLFANGTTNLVAVGTNDPQAKFHVKDAASSGAFSALSKQIIEGDNNTYLEISTPADHYGGVLFSDGTSGQGAILYDHTNDILHLKTSATNRLNISSAGNVGIGTATPGRLLELKDSSPYLSFNGTGTNEHEFVMGSDGHGFVVYDDTLDTYRFVIDQDSGNVGINTTSPQTKLHVMKASAGSPGYSSYANIILESDDHNYLQFSGPTDKNQGVLFGDGNDNAGAVYYDHASNYMRFFTNGSEKVRIDSAGKVGIGTNSPAYNLDVVGTTQLSGAATIDGTAEFKGQVNITGTTSSLNAIPRVQRDLLHAGPGTSTATLDTSGQQWLVKCLTTNTGVGNAPANFALTLPALGEVGSKYEIITVIGDYAGSVAGQTGNITIQGGNTGVTHSINGSTSAVTIDSRISSTQKYRMATVIRIGVTEWAMTVSDVGP
jgi:hypothetical protein